MVKTKKAILIGDYLNPPYHPLQKIDEAITEILSDEIEVQSTDDYQYFSASKLQDFQLCISYTDCWDQKIAPEYVAGLVSFVGNGGGLLVIHNGISIQSRFELAQLIGARFTGHPPMQQLIFKVSVPDHPVMTGVEKFEMKEEPYQFDFDPFSDRTTLLEYEYQEKLWPAAWAHHYGMGKVVFLMPGHELQAFQNESYRQIMRQSAQWLIL
jgi:type 1 glutamine amidotransferase